MGERRDQGDFVPTVTFVQPGVGTLVLDDEAVGVLPFFRRRHEIGLRRVPLIRPAADQHFKTEEARFDGGRHLGSGYAAFGAQNSHQSFNRTRKGSDAALQLVVHHVDRHLTDDRSGRNSRQRQDQHDGHHGDQQVRRDQAIPQAPNGLAQRTAQEPDQGHYAHREGRQRDHRRQSRRSAREIEQSVHQKKEQEDLFRSAQADKESAPSGRSPVPRAAHYSRLSYDCGPDRSRDRNARRSVWA